MFGSICIFCKEKFDLVIFHLQSQKLAIKCKKVSKIQFSFIFFFHFQGFEIRWEVQQNYQVSSRCSVLYIFPQRNTLESTWNLKEDAQKVSKVTISSHFWVLETSLGNMEKLKFSRDFSSIENLQKRKY